MLLVLGAPCQLPLLAGPEHGRTIADLNGLLLRCTAPTCYTRHSPSRCSGANSLALFGGDAASPFALAARKPDWEKNHARDGSCFAQYRNNGIAAHRR